MFSSCFLPPFYFLRLEKQKGKKGKPFFRTGTKKYPKMKQKPHQINKKAAGGRHKKHTENSDAIFRHNDGDILMKAEKCSRALGVDGI